MNNTFYAPRTDIALGFPHHHSLVAQPTTTNFIYFQMMQTSSPALQNTCSNSHMTTLSGQQDFTKLDSKIMSKGKDHTLTSSNEDEMEDDDDDENWVDEDEEEPVASPHHQKSYSFYFRFGSEDDESDKEDEEDDEEEEETEEQPEIPFWYRNEEPEHVEFIMKEYSSFLKLNEGRQPHSRRPIRFIGKIVREAIEDTYINVRDDEDDEDDEDSLHQQRVLITSETIYIYQKSVLSPELCCEFDSSIIVQTFYDFEEGIPISILIQPETEWDISSLEFVSLLECFPSFGVNPYEFQYRSNTVSEPSEICNFESKLTTAGLYNECLHNSAPQLARFKPKSQASPLWLKSEEEESKQTY